MLKIGIVDTDENFICRLREVFEYRYPDQFEIIYFPTFKKAQTAVKKMTFDALLINYIYKDDLKIIPKQCNTALLTENRASLKVLTVPAVCKYQSIDAWHDFLVTLCKSDGFSDKGGRNTVTRVAEMCLFTSTGGGVGASAAAAAFCVCCAKKGKAVLYLNFETFCSTERFFSGESDFCFDDVFYALRSEKYGLGPILKKSIVKDICGVEFIKPCQVIPDGFAVTGEEIIRICDAARSLNRFDFIVLDMNFESTENVVLPFLEAKITVLVTDGSINGNFKLADILKALPTISEKRSNEVLNKVVLLYNRFVTGISSVYENDEIARIGGISLIPTDDECELISKMADEFPIRKLYGILSESEGDV